MTGETRSFLFLQGPHGPFFDRLGRHLRAAGCEVTRVGVNSGDAAFWSDRTSYIRFTDPLQAWPNRLAELITEHAVTDIVLYGDTRPFHADAVKIARAKGLTTHIFEEGYLRPYWVTYERGGANGHSRLMKMGVDDMRRALEASDIDVAEAPAHWGDLYQHAVYGALYHLMILFANRRYAGFQPHRAVPVATEFRTYLKRILTMPVHRLVRSYRTARIKRAGVPYHLALLQLDHDASFLMHSPFDRQEEFVREVITGFAKGAPQHHHLVFKAHPMESGRVNLARIIKRIATENGVKARVHYVPGGKLAQILDHARTAVTVNSTAAQQVLWRGIPLKVFGKAVYAKPEFVADQPLHVFFERPGRPDTRAYRDYRRYLLETSQIAGGFYSASGRRQLLRQIVDMMLDPDDPYDALVTGTSAPRQQLRLVP